MTNIDPAFGHWFAGFTDGEGCFNIYASPRPGGATAYYPRFMILLREDDRPILEEIQGHLQIGRFEQQPRRGNSAPGIRFVVTKINECIILRGIFREFPLRAKKVKDFECWSRALDCSLGHKRGDSWSEMIDLYKELKSTHAYTALEGDDGEDTSV